MKRKRRAAQATPEDLKTFIATHAVHMAAATDLRLPALSAAVANVFGILHGIMARVAMQGAEFNVMRAFETGKAHDGAASDDSAAMLFAYEFLTVCAALVTRMVVSNYGLDASFIDHEAMVRAFAAKYWNVAAEAQPDEAAN